MIDTYPIVIRGGLEMTLCPEKVVWVKEHQLLICSDIHLGKVTHFRKAGIGVPKGAAMRDISEINDVLVKYRPSKMIIIGDLFHASYNTEWEALVEVFEVFKEIDFCLVKGNHDILSSYIYNNTNLEVTDDYTIGRIRLTHEPDSKEGFYNIYGHIHPGVMLKGPSRQSITLPCFIFGEEEGILPAFGRFTGLAKIKPQKNDVVYVVGNEEVINVTKN